eukprot:7020662-Lingulodinium_polyedra.AAC.1
MSIFAPASQQRPFSAWQRGVRACQPDVQMPGRRSAEQRAQKCAKLLWALPPDIVGQLDGLAEG